MTFLKACPGLSLKSMQTKVEALLSVASESLEMVSPNPAFSQILLSNIKLIFAINEQIHQAKVQINELAQSIPDYHLYALSQALGRLTQHKFFVKSALSTDLKIQSSLSPFVASIRQLNVQDNLMEQEMPCLREVLQCLEKRYIWPL